MINSSQMIYELKRKVEREYSELFPGEPPFVVSKIEDASGYALSNNSQVSDVLQSGDQITALPENNPDAGLHGGRARDHLMLLQNI